MFGICSVYCIPSVAREAMYTELHCHSYYSFLDGVSSPEALAERARALGMRRLALTDHEGVYGLPRFASAAEQHGLTAIYGAELTLTDGAHVLLLVRDLTGYRNLCRCISAAHLGRDKNDPRLAFEVLARHATGLIALSACEQGELHRALLAGGHEAACEVAGRYRDTFGADGYFVELHNHLRPEDARRNAALGTGGGGGRCAGGRQQRRALRRGRSQPAAPRGHVHPSPDHAGCGRPVAAAER